jgi:parallel beta-helix repeat protein
VLAAGAPTLAGELDPPAGAITPTMRTMDEVEPRVIVNATNAPGNSITQHRITSPGSYYLTGNLAGEPFKAGIIIASDDVTLDLMGFTILGGTNTQNGVLVEAGRKNFVIRNGMVVDREGGYGVATVQATGGVRIEKITVADCTGGILAGPETIVSDCVVRGVTASAIAGIETGIDGVVRDCVSCANAGHGFRLGSGTIAERCTARVNGGDGFRANGPVVIRRCTARLNEDDGIELLTTGHVSECVCMQNSDDGIMAAERGIVSDCIVRDNMGDGIELDDANLITANFCFSNNGHGIHVLGARNTIDSNKVSFNADGIRLASNSNVVTRNDFTGDTIVVAGGVNNVIGATNSVTCGWANFKAD